MTRWPDPERLLIASYLAGLGLRSPNSRAYYKQVLCSFQDVAERHAELGKDVLVAWVRASSDRWAASTVLHRTRVIDRFLDHLLETGTIDRNPVAALREACNIRQCKPVWRALASHDPNQALARLHQPKPSRLAITLRGVALAGGPAIFAQGEQRRLYSGGYRLGTAKRHQVPPEIAAAVDVDEAGQGHGGKPGRLCGGPLLLGLGLLRLQAVQIIRGALSVGGGAEYRARVAF
jgi:hypothetical protein